MAIAESNIFRLLPTEYTLEMAQKDEINWLEGIAKKECVVEKICPRRHVRQNDWSTEWNSMFRGRHEYDYISDYECIFNHPMDHRGNQHLQENQERWQKLQDAKNQGWPLQITDLVHVTEPENADQIVHDHGFRGGLKKINEEKTTNEKNDVKANLSWWNPIFNEEVKNNLLEHLGEVIKPFTREEDDDLDALKNQFATSPAFQPDPDRYGERFFLYGINELFQHYRQLIDGDPCYKILGTFCYKQEVMHAVLVCSEADGAAKFAGYPDVLSPEEDFNNVAVITRDVNGNWFWWPQTTGGTIVRLQAHEQDYPRYRRWEHVAFAFHIPLNKVMVCDRPANHQGKIVAVGESGDED